MQSKILITGASGFIGSNLLEYYTRKGCNVVNIDKSKPKAQEELKYWIEVDILCYEALETAILSFQPDIVIHLAARTDLLGKNITDYDSNTIGTRNLIKTLNQTPSVKRVIFTSSMLVCQPGYIPDHPIDYAPSTVYGESKVVMEKIIRKSALNYEWAIVRPTSIWGPHFSEPYRNFFDRIINQKYYHICHKACTKTYGYIENIIYQMDSILNAPVEKIQENVFYLGDYDPTNIRTWADEIASETGVTIKTIPYPLMKGAAFLGDLLKFIGINFPMTSFRLKNMTTNNVVNLSNIQEIAPNLPVSRIEGIRKTLKWLKDKT